MSSLLEKLLEYLEKLYNNPTLYYGIMIFLLFIWIILFIILVKTYFKKKQVKTDKPLIQPIILGEDVKVETKEDLESLLNKMEKDLESKENVVKTFEDEQEEKAIISYQELIVAKAKVEEPVIEEQPKLEEKQEETKEVDLDFTMVDSPKKFRNTEFISPIYGRVDEKNENNTFVEEVKQEEKSAVYVEPVDSIDEFLNDLKRFRKNLE